MEIGGGRLERFVHLLSRRSFSPANLLINLSLVEVHGSDSGGGKGKQEDGEGRKWFVERERWEIGACVNTERVQSSGRLGSDWVSKLMNSST